MMMMIMMMMIMMVQSMMMVTGYLNDILSTINVAYYVMK